MSKNKFYYIIKKENIFLRKDSFFISPIYSDSKKTIEVEEEFEARDFFLRKKRKTRTVEKLVTNYHFKYGDGKDMTCFTYNTSYKKIRRRWNAIIKEIINQS